MVNQQQGTMKILRALGVFLLMVAFFSFRYEAFDNMLVKGFLFVAGIACIIISALLDENLRKTAILSPRVLDGLFIGLLVFLYLTTLNHFGITTNAESARSLLHNNYFFFALLLFTLAGVIRSLL